MAGDASKLTAAFERLDHTVKEAQVLFGAAPDKAAPAGAPWGPREVLAHLIYWHDFTCRAFEEATEGRHARFPQESADEVNAHVVELYADRPMAEMVNDLAKVQSRFGEAVRVLKDPDTVVIIGRDGSPITALARLERVNAHYREHLTELKG